MSRPDVSLQYEGGWDALPFNYDEQPRPSYNGRPHQPASTPVLEPASNDIDFTGAIFDSNTGLTQSYDGFFDPTPQTLQSFNEDVSDGARLYDGQQPHPQNETATAPLYNIQPPQGPTVEEVSERYAYDDEVLAPHNIGVAHNLQVVPSHHSHSDVDTSSQISAYTGFFGTQVLTIGDYSVCSLCQTKFSGKFARGNCARHIRNIHAERSPVPDPKLVCRKCGKHFKRQDATVKHEKRKHGLHRSPRRRSGAPSTSHQTNDNLSDYGPSVYTESILEAPDTLEMTRRASQQSQRQIPDRTRNTSLRRTSQQSMPAQLQTASTTAQQLHPTRRSLQPLQTPITGAADFELPSDQSIAPMDMGHLLPSDSGTHPSGQELYSHGFSPFMASSHTSYAPINYQAVNKNPSNYAENYAHSLEPPSPYHLVPKWSPTLDNRKDTLYPQELSPSFAGLDFESEADYAHSSSQYHGFQQGPSAL